MSELFWIFQVREECEAQKENFLKLDESGLTEPPGSLQMSTQMLGTFAYAAPEFSMTGEHTIKGDVYSFGVVLLELMTGRKPVDSSRPRYEQSLVRWVRPQRLCPSALPFYRDDLVSFSGRLPVPTYSEVSAARQRLLRQGHACSSTSLHTLLC